MSEISHIEWTDATWNPVRGCTKISPGCTHCYAETFAERFRGVPNHPYKQGFELRLVPERLLDPFRWPKAKRVFVNSMSDLFHKDVPTSFIEAVAQVMCETPWHTYQVLTKRADRLRQLLSTELRFAANKYHIWWGVSVEDRKYGLPRVGDLQSAPAEIRFLSIEPLLEDLGQMNLEGIAWVIVGGESGRGARPMKEDWVLSILQQCRVERVPFFFKQWGGVNKARAGRLLSGATYDEYPEIIRSAFPDRRAREQMLETLAHKLRKVLRPTLQGVPIQAAHETSLTYELFGDSFDPAKRGG